MEIAQGYSSRIDQALALAALAHRDQRRKGTDVPYIVHPFHVARILERHGYGEDVVIAGILHDVLEDTDLPAAEIERRFGRRVLELVQSATETKREGSVRRPWRARKEEQLAHLERAKPEEAALKAADALHNVRSLLGDLEAHGVRCLDRFNAPAADILWRYAALASLARRRLGDANSLGRELAEAVRELESRMPPA